MVDVSVAEQFGNSDHNSVSFTELMDKDKCSPPVKVLNWGKANYNNIRPELKNVGWGQMSEGKSTSGMWDAFNSKLTGFQDRHIPVRMKDKYDKFRKLWITGDIMSRVRKKKEAFVNARRLGTHEVSVDYKESRKKLKQGVRRAKRGHEMSLASRIEENPKGFYTYIKSKRVARERVGPLKDR